MPVDDLVIRSVALPISIDFGATVVFITVQQLLLVLRAPVASDAPAAQVPAGAVAVATS